MKITIQTTDNDGYIITYPHPNTEGDATECFAPVEKFSEEDMRKSECECTASLLWAVLDAIGMHRSKHSAYNVIVSVEDNRENR